ERSVDSHDVLRTRESVGQRWRLLDRAADDRLDDFVKLGGMRSRQKNAWRTFAHHSAFDESEVRDGAVRIQQIAPLLVNAPNRRHDFVVHMAASRNVAPHRPYVAV